MNILRITAEWSGFQGAPGYSNFHFSSDAGFWDGGLVGDEAQTAADSAAARVKDAFDVLRLRLHPDIVVRVSPEALVIDSDTGEIQGQVDIDSRRTTGGATSDNYAGPVGAVANWSTQDYRFGRRIRGRTFLVPLSSNSYDTDGTLSSSALGDVRDFASAMVADGADPHFGVWSRPRGGSGGVFATVTGYNVPDMAAVLRSRRD